MDVTGYTALRQAGFRIDRMQVHQTHQATYTLDIHVIALEPKHTLYMQNSCRRMVSVVCVVYQAHKL
ncbi:hypothetical protein T230_01760 [Tannerella sp. oral taxon BU063 isolate Cell 1/3]|uniref:Uncharacterized protein n=1 Tax=Tannerella sp. oral taxon BU063 isolate Cell 1/3 TaxID=1411022 RepID=W2CUM6_9BACT|nr:hypothetical protein T230_01760 [Tannerella sp. oral taxon BU063 isolate Cell 1/3]